ncbi:MAG TPA: CDP-diacylglycerol diphosphatase [Acetobacteraceae bacterium]|nr:CDP-diacylglycerol diphosphatase [Acetobacteraceae bacterium]
MNPSRHSRPPLGRLALLALLLSFGLAGRAAADPSALWHIVHGKCVPDLVQKHNPAPCAAVNLEGGYAVLKDRRGPYQFLLIPTARVSGIDDRSILAPGAPNYWQAAWQARHFLEQRVGRAVPRDVLSLAINSALGRSQNQLHIHVDCIRPDVRAALRQHLEAVGPHWAPFPVPLAGQRYRAMRIVQADLKGINPFDLLARSIPASEMRRHTLVVAAVMFGEHPGFVLLDDRANPLHGNFGHGESLQDHTCALLR